jgi:uncharacterized damage-inducible protein DinB
MHRSSSSAAAGVVAAVEAKPTPAAPDAVCPAAAAAVSLLEQCDRFVGSIDDASYARTSAAMMGGTIGKHVRHCLDHFAAIVAAMQDGGVIDYDHRLRDVPMETDRAEARRAISGLVASLRAIDASATSTPVTVRVMLSADGAEASLSSTLARELAFASHHAVHHHAMMKVIADELGLPCPEGFGKAPSTLNHEQKSAAPAAADGEGEGRRARA